MFTGIIESRGRIISVESNGANRIFEIESDISAELKPDQSVCHNGVCLTVTKVNRRKHFVTCVVETLKKSNLDLLAPGDWVNLERSMLNNGRFDGHLVQGHVDQTALCTGIQEVDGSWLLDFDLKGKNDGPIVEKGSITIDGISLTCFKVAPGSFRVAVIPFTYENTNLGTIKENDTVNVEFDIIGKYVKHLMQSR